VAVFEGTDHLAAGSVEERVRLLVPLDHLESVAKFLLQAEDVEPGEPGLVLVEAVQHLAAELYL